MDPVKVAGVCEWPTPTNQKEVQSFLGFANLYQQFICDFSHHARPLFDLTKTSVPFSWDGPANMAFETIKKLITSAPVLITPNEHQPFWIEADSSDFATGAILSQEDLEDGKYEGRKVLLPDWTD